MRALVLAGATAVFGLQHRFLVRGRFHLLPAAKCVVAAAARRALPAWLRVALLHPGAPVSARLELNRPSGGPSASPITASRSPEGQGGCTAPPASGKVGGPTFPRSR